MESDYLLRVAFFKRREFFKLWNQLNDSEWAYEILEKKLSLIEKELGELPPAGLPPHIRFVSMLDADYPAELYQLHQPPVGLFIEGYFGRGIYVGVVGSRKPTPYAKRVTREVVRLWTKMGYKIVSGGAIGIDGDAHEACLHEGGITVVILGGGHSHLHPRSHRNLFQEVVKKGGALISEYPPHFEPRPYTFPERNRLIAALSSRLFLAQAHEKSGSLITSKAALDLGREIYVLRPVPGDPQFRGSEILLDDGAHCLMEAADLLDLRDLNPDSEHPLLPI